MSKKNNGLIAECEPKVHAAICSHTSALRQLSAQQPDAWPVWSQLSPWLNDCTHGGPDQLVGNNLQPSEGYPGEMFWTAMLVSTVAMLVTSGWFWHHMGHEDRAQRVLTAIGSENWDRIETMCNGQTVRIVAPVPTEADLAYAARPHLLANSRPWRPTPSLPHAAPDFTNLLTDNLLHPCKEPTLGPAGQFHVDQGDNEFAAAEGSSLCALIRLPLIEFTLAI